MVRMLATGVAYSLDQARRPNGKRPSDVLQIEKIITDSIGPDASLIHTGRSRQDKYATYRMAKLRNEVLDFSDALDGLRERLLVLVVLFVVSFVLVFLFGVLAL